MNTIPLSQLVSVNPSVLAAAGTQNDLNGLILTENTAVPPNTIMPFATATDVGNFFGLSSTEYELALIYFPGPDGSTKSSQTLNFAQYPSAAVPAYLRGANPNLTLAQLQSLTGTLTVDINGVANTSASINLSGATSFANAATLIQAGFTAPNFTVTYDTQRQAFLFTSSVSGITSTATYASGALSAALALTAATGATLAQGADAGTPSTVMTALTELNYSWAAFTTTWEPVTADKVSFSQWTSQQDHQYLYVGYDSDPNALLTGQTTTWGYQIAQAQYDGTLPIWGDATHAAFVLGYAATLDFTRTNGRKTLAYRSQAGLVPAVSDATSAQNLLANGYDFYGVYASGSQQFNVMQPGSVTGKYLWVDSYLNQIWMRTNFQLAMINLLMGTGSIPYNADGDTLIGAALADPIQAAKTFGAIREGVTLSASQAQEVNQAVGKIVAPVIQATGVYVDIADAPVATRVARGSPPLTVYYTDGQSVQALSLDAIEIE